jgi:hypothetical protein
VTETDIGGADLKSLVSDTGAALQSAVLRAAGFSASRRHYIIFLRLIVFVRYSRDFPNAMSHL